MEKSVLLVLLLLQVFLLITAFTSADAAALVTGPQQPPDPVVRRNDRNMRGYSNCSWRPGGCTLVGSSGITDTIPPIVYNPPPPLPHATGPALSPEELLKYLKGKHG